jgi:hypothetical protein
MVSAFPGSSYIDSDGLFRVVMAADGTAISLAQSGSVGPNLGFLGGDANAGADQTVNNGVISNDWRAFVAYWDARGQADKSTDWPGIIQNLINDIKAIYPYVAAVISILA